VTWDFGDGTPQVVTIGEKTAWHVWTEPGNYVLTATVRNALGTTRTGVRCVIASTVAWIAMKAARVAETEPSVKLTFVRSGELGRRVSVTFRSRGVDRALHAGDTELVFEADEVTKSIEVLLEDNKVYDGLRRASIELTGETGGVRSDGVPVLWIEDDEPRPTLTAQNVVVREGDGGRTRIAVPVALSAPLGTDLFLYGSFRDDTAAIGDDWWLSDFAMRIAAGELTGTIALDVIGDVVPELDERLTFTLGTYGGFDAAPLTGPPVTITIINDDVAITPGLQHGSIGDAVALTLYPGEHFDQPRDVVVRSTNPSAVQVPPALAIPPGAAAVPFEARLQDEGPATIIVALGEHTVSAHINAVKTRTVVANPRALCVAQGATAQITVSLAPARDMPLEVMLNGTPGTIAVPESVTIPAGGEATFEVRGLNAGGAAVGIASHADGIIGRAVIVDVTPPAKRARTMR
jgi:hypothetical protein